MTQADQIRQYVIEHYIQPARAAGKKLITIRAGTIHVEMQLEDQLPNVCSSLDAQKFYDQAVVTLVKRSGPKQSSTAEWVLALVQVNAMDLENQTPAWEYGGKWGSEPIVINRWSTTIDIDLDSFDYRFGEGLSEIFNRYSLANQCHPDRRKITKTKIIYIFHWKYREIQFSTTLVKHTKGTVKVQIEQYRSAPHSPEYIRSRIDDIIEWIHREFEVQVKEERGSQQSTLGMQMPDLQLIYENTVATATLNNWLRTFFQENQDRMWEIYNGMLSWSIAERDIVNLIGHTVDTMLIVAEFKVIPILYVNSVPVDDYSTQVRICLGAERLSASKMQAIIKQALEPAKAESAKPGKDNLPTGRPIKILFLAANPLDAVFLRTDEESRAIDAALRKAANRNFDIRLHGAVRIDDLQELLLRHQPDIVHFSGHGTEEHGLILVDANGNGVRVSGAALRQLFAVLKGNIRCIVLNACYTEAQAKGLAEVIDCVIGIEDAISDEGARQFATAFYRALGYEKSIGDAFALGQVQIELAGLGEGKALHLLTRADGAGTFTFATDSSNQSKPLVTPQPPTTNH